MIRPMVSSAFGYYKKFKDYETHFSLELKIVAIFQKNIDFENINARREALLQMRRIISDYLNSPEKR